MSDERKKRQSPYQRYQKAPFIYSETYRAWKQAVMRGDRDEAARVSRRHATQFGYAAAFPPRTGLRG